MLIQLSSLTTQTWVFDLDEHSDYSDYIRKNSKKNIIPIPTISAIFPELSDALSIPFH